MYATCLFCKGDLGRNEAIEAFPVGRRLAFDAAKGRLWVVCTRCERWNLTPLEERWEAIEACEREFRATRLRVSTDEIGLARLKEGLQLVRIGAPQRPEMAAWRYGDQFGRRRQRAMLIGGATALGVGGYLLAVPMLGLIGPAGVTAFNVINMTLSSSRGRAIVARIPMADGVALRIRRAELAKAAMRWDEVSRRWCLELSHLPVARGTGQWWKLAQSDETSVLRSDDAVRAARLILPTLNSSGARRVTVREAVGYLEESPSPEAMFGRAARSFATSPLFRGSLEGRIALTSLPTVVRLALEMSSNEETERRALEEELHLLEAAWREAEEIAGIADDMFLPSSVQDAFARLKRNRER